jgi:uncharacterized protein (DUF885 family)
MPGLRSALVLLVFTLLTAPLAAAQPAQPSASSRALAEILDDFHRHALEVSHYVQMQEGRKVTRLPDASYEGTQREAALLRSWRERLAKLDPAGLSHEEQLTRDILDWEAQAFVELSDHFWAGFQVTAYNNPLRGLEQVFAAHTFSDEADTARYLDLVRQYATLAGQLRANLETQRSRGMLLPKEGIDAVATLFRALAKKPEASPLTVAPARLKALPAEKAAAFEAEVRRLLEASVNPALEGLATFITTEEYRRAAPDRVGLGQYPGGEAAYRQLVRYHTSLDLAPEEIHRRGLDEVARIGARMAGLREKLGFQGTQGEFHHSLKTDPRFLAKTADDVAERLMAPIRRIEPKVSSYFLRTPKAPYGVARLDPGLEAVMTYGTYHQPTPANPRGEYMFNGSRLDQRSQLNAAALIYHELVPGHHFQIALQMENESLPAMRRNSLPTAFTEGWGEYASDLAEEMGLYADPYDLYGRLAMDAFLSSRLVVDTGMNALGWPRQKAIDFLREHTLESDVQINTETLRYAVDIPGQALAYKTGASKFWELRRKAEKALGPKFDIRRFHEALLGSGAMPLTILEKHVDWWIEGEKLSAGS